MNSPKFLKRIVSRVKASTSNFLTRLKAQMIAIRHAIMVSLLLAVGSVPAFAQSGTLTVDTAAFIDQINNWLPMALQIVGIGVGIAGAFALAGMVGTMIINAFKGRFGS